MPKHEKPPTIDVNSPLQRGHRWIFVPMFIGAALSIFGSFLISHFTSGC